MQRKREREMMGGEQEGGEDVEGNTEVEDRKERKRRKKEEKKRRKKEKKEKKGKNEKTGKMHVEEDSESDDGESDGEEKHSSSSSSSSSGSKKNKGKNHSSKKPQGTGRDYTVSIALPGSIIDNAQSPELRSYVAGQIARALAVCCVDEVVIYSEYGEGVQEGDRISTVNSRKDAGWNPNVFLGRVLQYLETPQYLRKAFFPHHSDLRFAGLMNPLDGPHHPRMDEIVPYREGVVTNQPARKNQGSWVNCGLMSAVQVDKQLKPGVRVTVKMEKPNGPRHVYKGKVVAPSTPREEGGIYWGYQTRLAAGIGNVFTECPFKGGYDLCVGTSERGQDLFEDDFELPSFKHVLIVFGGLAGLEAAVAADENLDVNDPELLFDMYVNTCPEQGSRTIRTEEAILISLTAMYPFLHRKGKPWSQ